MPVDGPADGWRPLLSGEAADRALDAVDQIGRALRAAFSSGGPSASGDFSLAGGDAGLALFFAYLHAAFGRQDDEDLALALLERAVGGLGEAVAVPSLYSGFSGVAWVAEHLRGRLLDPDADPGEDLAAALSAQLRRAGRPWHFDLINGLIGFGVYGLERWPHPGARECVEGAVARLAETAERSASGVAWRTPPEASAPAGSCFPGVAHGQTAAIAFLAAAAASGMAGGKARALLSGVGRWLLDHRLEEPRPTRLSWCHGDLGIAAALLAAARHTGDEDWEREARELARAAAARTAEAAEKAEIKDACLCHGTAGVAHLFNRLFQATGDPSLGEAARFWAARTLEMRQPGAGVAGFRSWSVDEGGEEGWKTDPGFLNGAAGIGLALLAAATGVEPAWDRVMLISIPKRSG